MDLINDLPETLEDGDGDSTSWRIYTIVVNKEYFIYGGTKLLIEFLFQSRHLE